jgi:hypothetical protein
MPALMHAGANLPASERAEKTFSRSPAYTFSFDFTTNLTSAFTGPHAKAPATMSCMAAFLPAAPMGWIVTCSTTKT